jgi:hypothetical protein
MDEKNLGPVVPDFSDDPGDQGERRKNVACDIVPRVHEGVHSFSGRLRLCMPNVISR